MNIIFQTQLKKKVIRLPKKVRRALGERLELFKSNPFNSILNNHMLHGKYEGYRSINITGDYRLIFEVISSDAIAVIDFDTHHSLYGN